MNNMAFENPIILDNAGDNNYGFLTRDWTTNPVTVKYMRLILADESQLAQAFEIKNRTSTGEQSNRIISLGSYVKSSDKTNLIVVIPFNPPLIMDGNTYFVMKVPALSDVQIMFYYKQKDII
jgi:hypothetical protein